MSGYLLDTNHMSAAILRVSKIRDRIFQERKKGLRFGTCVPVLCELEVAIRQSGNIPSCRRYSTIILEEVRVWPVEEKVIRSFGEVYIELKSVGRILSHVDLVLVSLARSMNVTLLTTDRDFEAVPDVRVENWLAEE